MKATHHLRFAQITGGYGIHQATCDCTEAQPPRGLRRPPLIPPVACVTEGVARLYSTGPVGVVTPDRFALRECATAAPLHEGELLPWKDHHARYMGTAAVDLWVTATSAQHQAGLAHEKHDSRPPGARFWSTPSHAVREIHHAAYRASAYHTAVTVPGVVDRATAFKYAEEIILRVELIIRDNLELLLGSEVGHGSTLERAYYELDLESARSVARQMRSVLAPVYAHRALRTLVQ